MSDGPVEPPESPVAPASPEPVRPAADSKELAYLSVTGDPVREKVMIDGDAAPAPAALTARWLQLASGQRVRQLLVGASDQQAGYEQLDNEILAGLRLVRVAGTGAYPAEVSRLIGYEPTSAAPFVLLAGYRGEALTGVAARQLMPDERRRFQISLLTALCWLAAAGIAHRAIGPSTVFWDGRRVQITDFSRATVVGVPRQPVGGPPWAAPEQRPGQVSGYVSTQDDLWAAGQLIYYVCTGEERGDRDQSTDPELDGLLSGVFGPAETRPSPQDLLVNRLGQDVPVPAAPVVDPRLTEGRRRFAELRARKHPETAGQDVTVEGPPDGASPVPGSGPGSGRDDIGPGDTDVRVTAADAEPAQEARLLGRRMPWRFGAPSALITLVSLVIR
jgi:Protein kinase domain